MEVDESISTHYIEHGYASSEDDFKLASEIAVTYGDMQLGLTNASIVVQAARHKTTRILSLDHKHFGAVHPLTGGTSFTLLPRDDEP